MKKQITEAFDRIRKLLNDDEKQLHAKIDEIEQKNQLILKDHELRMDRLQNILNELKNQFEKTKNSRDPVLLLRRHKAFDTKSDETLSTIQSLKSPATIEFAIYGLQYLEKSVQKVHCGVSVAEMNPVDNIKGLN